MLAVAHTFDSATEVQRLAVAFSRAPLLRVSLDVGATLGSQGALQALVLDQAVLSPIGIARLASLKACYPDLLTLALLPPEAELLHQAFQLGGAGIDEILIAGAEDHPERLREILGRARIRTVARTVERHGGPLPPSFAAPDLERILSEIALLTSSRRLASSLGLGLRGLRNQLRDAGLFPPRTTLAYLRLLVAGRRVGDSDESIERIALALGYESAPAFRNSWRKLLGGSPGDMRRSGGLRRTGEAFGSAVSRWRAAALIGRAPTDGRKRSTGCPQADRRRAAAASWSPARDGSSPGSLCPGHLPDERSAPLPVNHL